MLKQRVITAVCLAISFLLSLFWLPTIGFSFFVAIFLLVGAWEWANLSGFSSRYQKALYCGLSVVLAVVIAQYLGLFLGEPLEQAKILSVFIAAGTWWTVALLWVQGYPSSTVLWGNQWIRAIMGLFVLIPSGLALTFLHQQPHGVWLILMVVAIVATADIGAYFFGRHFGRRKLAKAVSPGKSWEGVFGGLFACSLLALAIAWIVNIQLWLMLLAIVLPTAMVSVLGDLLESMVKRHRGVKDSGSILPGHGGVLDRLDGFTAALPIFVLAVILSGWRLSL